MKSPPIQEVRSLEQLRAIDQTLGSFALFGPVPHLKFAMAGVPEDRNRAASETMANYQNECGCLAGGITMGLSFLAYIAFFVVSGETPLQGGLLLEIAFCIALLTGSTLVGKALGRWWAKVQRIRLIRRLARRAELGPAGMAS